jgi:hypothetical protein
MESKENRLDEMIPAVVLPEGYRGKILLVCVTVGAKRAVLLRSGDLWHREILRSARAEIRARLPGAQVDELGGAHLRFEADGSILIWGGSDEFGACDHLFAATLLKAAWPGRRITCISGEMP